MKSRPDGKGSYILPVVCEMLLALALDYANISCQIADVPRAHISTDSKGCFGSTTIFKSSVTTPSLKLKGIEWQSSSDGKKFVPIDISKPHYHGSKLIPLPLLVISKTKFEDNLYYRLHVWNIIGDRFSNELYLDVRGSMNQCFNELSKTVKVVLLN